MAIMIGLDVRSRFRREHCEGGWCAIFSFAPNTRNRQERSIVKRESVLRLRVFLSGELSYVDRQALSGRSARGGGRNDQLYRARAFARLYPDLDEWVSAPLGERIGSSEVRHGRAFACIKRSFERGVSLSGPGCRRS